MPNDWKQKLKSRTSDELVRFQVHRFYLKLQNCSRNVEWLSEASHKIILFNIANLSVQMYSQVHEDTNSNMRTCTLYFYTKKTIISKVPTCYICVFDHSCLQQFYCMQRGISWVKNITNREVMTIKRHFLINNNYHSSWSTDSVKWEMINNNEFYSGYILRNPSSEA